ncbi:glutamate decarboxylase [Listeria booriae]|uniref:glutamate decarboxylase n=1 Tax=Listeria booriae TaxID=1552123 RepID=UPI00162A93AF|nr:glutamate decarboxylase [Listeria booriae]MBC2369298.1 glutamate decarboxylase [Listeria booriae]
MALLGGNKSDSEHDEIQLFYGKGLSEQPLPRYEIPKDTMPAGAAYDFIMDELRDEGSARQNLATFVQTWMEPEAQQLIMNTLDKNAVDKSEYPQTAEIEERCVNIIANLWHADQRDEFIGTSTVGSSEACMLGGMAALFRWKKQARELGLDMSKRPNLIISSAYQVVWEKFGVYWDVELREVPVTKECLALDPEKAIELIDDYTICVVGIMGLTYTGRYDDIKALDAAITTYNETSKVKVYIHVDAASGGLYTPFMEPDLEWDFRLDNVKSINTSGHKYGLVYPGVGWVLWKDKTWLPEELIFNVSYLGGDMPTMAINFSRPASLIVAQYYLFLRLGFEGFRQVHARTQKAAKYITKEIEKLDLFEVINGADQLPVIAWTLKEDPGVAWDLYDLSDFLRMRGWQVPAYPMPADLEEMVVLRAVIKGDFSYDSALLFVRDLKASIEKLNKSHIIPNANNHPKTSHGFTH